MSLLKLIKNNLFIQNFAASIISAIPPYLEFSVSKYFAIKKAMYVTAHDATHGSYLEFGVFTGSSFNFAIKAKKKMDKIFGKMDCEFIGFDSFQGFGEISKNDEHPAFKNKVFSVFVNKEKVIQNIQKISKGQKSRIIEGFYKDTIKNKTTVDFKIDKVHQDTDLNATEAVNYLYHEGIPVSKIQKTFSVGSLGVRGLRKLVPTRWSITAVDNMISLNLIEKIKKFHLRIRILIIEYNPLF